MADRDESHSPTAKDLLVMLANAGAAFTPAKALELAAMLCHIAGGDGRGVYTIRHNPTGDQIPPPWPGLTECHGMEINVDGASVTPDSFGGAVRADSIEDAWRAAAEVFRDESYTRDDALRDLRAIADGTYLADPDDWYSPPPSEGSHALADGILLRLIGDSEISAAFDDIEKWYA